MLKFKNLSLDNLPALSYSTFLLLTRANHHCARKLYQQTQSAFLRGEDEQAAKICEAYIRAQEAASGRSRSRSGSSKKPPSSSGSRTPGRNRPSVCCIPKSRRQDGMPNLDILRCTLAATGSPSPSHTAQALCDGWGVRRGGLTCARSGGELSESGTLEAAVAVQKLDAIEKELIYHGRSVLQILSLEYPVWVHHGVSRRL